MTVWFRKKIWTGCTIMVGTVHRWEWGYHKTINGPYYDPHDFVIRGSCNYYKLSLGRLVIAITKRTPGLTIRPEDL